MGSLAEWQPSGRPPAYASRCQTMLGVSYGWKLSVADLTISGEVWRRDTKNLIKLAFHLSYRRTEAHCSIIHTNFSLPNCGSDQTGKPPRAIGRDPWDREEINRPVLARAPVIVRLWKTLGTDMCRVDINGPFSRNVRQVIAG